MSDQGQPQKAGKASQRLLRFSRILNLADRLHLSPGPKDMIKATLQREIGQPSDSAPKKVHLSPDQQSQIRQYELKIRQLVQGGAKWNDLEGVCWQYFQAKNDPQAAGRLVELCLLYGEERQLEKLIETFVAGGINFYFSINRVIRSRLLYQNWSSQMVARLQPFILLGQDLQSLAPVERLYIFLCKVNAQSPSDACNYYSQYQKEIWQATSEMGAIINVSPGRLNYTIATLLIKTGKKYESRQYLEAITPSDKEYDDALRWLLTLDGDKRDLLNSKVYKAIQAETSWEKRITIFRLCFENLENLGGVKDKNRAYLNLLLENPLQWVPKSTDSWFRLSLLIIQYQHLIRLLPNLFSAFKEHCLTFHDQQLDLALWQGWLQEKQGTDVSGRYFMGVAYLHQFVASLGSDSFALWRAKEMIEDGGEIIGLPNWNALHQAANEHLQSLTHLDGRVKHQITIEMALASSGKQLSLMQIEYYLNEAAQPSMQTLNMLRALVKGKNELDLEEKLLRKISELTRLRNNDYDRYWQIACTRENNDLAWRIATLLFRRQALLPQVAYAWQISGENRKIYPILQLQKSDLELCFSGFSQVYGKLAMTCFQAGPAMAELLAILDPNSKLMRQKFNPDSFEAQLDKVLRACLWLSTDFKKWQYSDVSDQQTSASTPFFGKLVAFNEWSYVVCTLIDRMGLSAWSWDFERLGYKVKEVLPDLGSRIRAKKLPSKVLKWMRNLNPQQRSAWNELAIFATKSDGQWWNEDLAKIVCRIATVIYPNHQQALETLQGINAPLWLIGDLEKWIVSPQTSQLRGKYRLASQVLVPESLKKLPTILTGDRRH